jgi:hypothetical protein
MSVTVTATLIFDGSDPPTVTSVVDVDGIAAARRELAPSEVIAALGVVAPDAPNVWQVALDLVQALGANVQQQTAAQVARQEALAAWQAAIAALPSAPTP